MTANDGKVDSGPKLPKPENSGPQVDGPPGNGPPGNGPHGTRRKKKRGWPEFWVWLMFLLVLAVVLGHLYVFHGSDRDWAIWMYKRGRFMAVLGACIVGLLGIVQAVLRPPMVRPWRLEGVLMALLIIFSAPVPYNYPSSFRDSPEETVLTLPVRGTWRVLSGGRDSHNPLTLEPDRCYGLLIGKEVDGQRYLDPTAPRSDHLQSLSFGEPVYAPADGEVVAAVDDEPDRSFQLRVADASSWGNHLVLRLQSGAFLVLSHLEKDSLAVGVGDQVQAGQMIGRVGSSGRGIPLTESHLGLHISSELGEFQGEGIPFRMGGYRLGDEIVEAGIPQGGLGRDGGVLGDLIESLR